MHTRQNHTTNKRQTGFTLIELVISLAIIAITSSVAIPAFSSFVSANRLATQSNSLVSALNYTRSEAVKRSQVVTITSNNSTSWQDGWAINTADGTLLQQTVALTQGSTLVGSVTAVQYQASGTTNSASTITFILCIDAGAPGRQIELNPIGRPFIDRNFICP